MDLLVFTTVGCGILSFTCLYLIHSRDRILKSRQQFLDRMIDKNSELSNQLRDAYAENDRLKRQPAQKKEVLTVDAQQILHDMTAHGQAVVRILPINPNDVFWRSPK